MSSTWLERLANVSNCYECAEDFILEECETYGDMANMARELLSFFGDIEHDQAFVGMLSVMVRDYLDEVV